MIETATPDIKLETLGIDEFSLRVKPLRVVMLTPFKTRGAAEMSGISDSALNWYSGRLARELLSEGVNMSVVGSRAAGTPPERWDDDGIPVFSSFVRRSPWAVLQAFRALFREDAKIIHVQHELFAFGGIISAFLLPIALFALRVLGRRCIVTTIHGVIPLSQITREFVRANRVPANARIAKYLWRFLIRAVTASSSRVHVHEPFLRNFLIKDYGVEGSRVDVVPLGVEQAESRLDKIMCREKFGLPHDAEVAMFFGYLAAYKGVEYLLDEIPRMLAERPNLHIVLAGGIPTKRLSQVDPQKTLKSLPLSCQNRFRILGFVPEESTAPLFGSADVLILPYKMAISSSGPLSLAVSYDLPVLLSSAFKSSFPDGPVCFDLEPGQLTLALQRYFENSFYRMECRGFVRRLRAERNWASVAKSLKSLYSSASEAKFRTTDSVVLGIGK